MKTKKLLNKKITQWLLLVAMLVGCSANAWADSAAGQVIYMQPGSNWGQASATFKMKGELSGTYSSAVSMTKVCDNSGETDDLYSATVSSSKEYNKLQFLRYNSDGTTQWCYSATQSYESGKNFISIGNSCNNVSFSSGYGWLCNNTIYFDNTETNWSKVYLRVGHDTYNSKYDMEKVKGTANLYKYTIPSWVGFKAWGISNNVAWTGSHSIYSTCQSDDTYDITGHTDYIKESVTTDYTVIAGSDCTQGTGDKNKCTYFYSRTTYQSKKTWTVTITTPTNGSITVSYTDEDNNSQSFSSDSQNVLPTCTIIVTATPSDGYKLKSLTLDGSAFTSGNIYNVRKDITISATFESACTDPTADKFTYTSSANYTDSGISANVAWKSGTGSGEITTYYEGTSGTSYTKSTTPPTNAGKYNISINAAAGGSYCGINGLSLGTMTINKINQSTLSITTSTAARCVSASPLTLETSGGNGEGAVTYEIVSGGTGAGTILGNILTVTKSGTIMVKAKKASDTNYNETTSATVTFTFNGTTVTTEPALDKIHPYEVVTFTADKAVTWAIVSAPTGVNIGKNAYFPWESTEQGTASIRFKGAKGTSGGYSLTATTTDGCATDIEFNIISDSEKCN